MASKRSLLWALLPVLAMVTLVHLGTAYSRDLVAAFRWFAGMSSGGAPPALSASTGRFIPGGVDAVPVGWELLGQLDFRTGQRSAELVDLEGAQVRIPGYAVPLDGFASETNEFLLVPYVGACVHVPPPPPNQLVYVEMEEGRPVPFSWWEPVWIYGSLHIDETSSVYGSASFRLEGLRSEPYPQ